MYLRQGAALLAAGLFSASAAAVASQAYTWKNVKIGGMFTSPAWRDITDTLQAAEALFRASFSTLRSKGSPMLELILEDYID